MSAKERWVVEYAYYWGKARGIRWIGAIYAVENHGKMRGVQQEYSGDECAGPGQNNVRYASIRSFGNDYTSMDYAATRRRLQTDLVYCLEDSYIHIKYGLKKYDYDWQRWKHYNGINAPHERYPAKVQAWLKFLDGLFENTNRE